MGSETKPACCRKRRQRPLPSIAGRHFSGVGELEAEINRIRRDYGPLDTPMIGEEADLVAAWMEHHESIEETLERHGPVQHIEVRWNPGVYKGPGRPEHDRNQLTLVFADGFSEPFSYRAAHNLFGVIPTGLERHRKHWRWLRTAGRCLIADDIREFRDVHLEIDGRCEISGQEISIDTAEVHHSTTPFGWMLYGFLREHLAATGLCGFEVEVIDTDSVGGKRFADDELCDRWVAHHCEQAQLQVLEKSVHRQQHVGLKLPPFLDLFGGEKIESDWSF